MRDLGIESGDTLVIDKSLKPKHLNIAMVNWESGFMVKQLRRRGGRLELHSGNPGNAPSSFPMTWGWMSGRAHLELPQAAEAMSEVHISFLPFFTGAESFTCAVLRSSVSR
ncbi:LexA family protein [uncultured Xanthomonas sp.]|uniref:LexA family protein n=1 Tax=uncultured Xanthomonas sp. TaxID=152831 RepID=UPI003747A13D